MNFMTTVRKIQLTSQLSADKIQPHMAYAFKMIIAAPSVNPTIIMTLIND